MKSLIKNNLIGGKLEKYAAVILAAGKGTRMNEGSASPIPKVMFPLNGKTIIDWSVDSIKNVGVNRIVLVVGYKKELVEDHFKDQVEYAVQEEQLGTGHAVAQAKLLLGNQSESVIAFYGDNPLYKPETIKHLMNVYESEKPTIAMLSVVFKDPKFWAFGRITRDQNGAVTGIVEQKDCSPEQLEIQESNPGFYIFDANWLWDNIDQLEANNAQKELYLTDMIGLAVSQGKKVIAVPVSEETEALGVNTLEQLRQAEEVLKSREQIQN